MVRETIQTEKLVKLELKITPEMRGVLKEWAARNGFDNYASAMHFILKNMQNGTLFTADTMSFDRWYQHMLNQLDRAARRAAREEALLVLSEQGFVSNNVWEK